MNLEGRLLGNRYEILEQVGNGGMATVYKAKCHVLNRYVAVKILKDEYTTDSEFIKRFNVEAQAVASLTHPNIVSVYDVGKEGNLYYIVMELVQGKTLKEIIQEDGALSWKWSVNIAIQIASALETAHRNHIIHRDIKPHNIIITEDGMAKVTDFGIAKAVSNSTITAFGTTIGSVHYFSPEHAKGGYTDEKSDIYSLGVVLYEMVTGRVPFDADTPVSVALKHMQEPPLEPIKLNPSIPISVNKIILKAMQKNPILRYSSATEILRDLRMALKNPDGNFVVSADIPNDFPTQHVPLMYDKSIEDKIKEKDMQRPVEGGNRTRKKSKNKLAEFFNEHRALGVISIAGAAVLLFAIAIMIGAMSFMKGSVTPEVEIPDLIKMSQEENKSVEDIQKYVENAKLKLKIEEDYNSEIPADQVYKQEPAAGTTYDNRKKTVKEGETITIWVSKGEKIVNVPEALVGKTKDEVVSKIEEQELKVEIVEEASDVMEAGKVIRVEPAEKSEIPAGSTIKVVISTGIEQVQVPDLKGKTEEEAKAAIAAAGLKYKATKTTSDAGKENGKIVEQDIVAGSVVDKGTPITITLNKFDEVKTGSINVNVSSALGGYSVKYDSEGNPIKPKSVSVVLLLDGKEYATKSSTEDSVSCIFSIDSSGSKPVSIQIKSETGSVLTTRTITYSAGEVRNIP